MPPCTWRLRYWAFLQLAYPATLAPICLFPYVSEAWGWGIWLPWRMRPMSERPMAVGSAIRFLTAQDARVRGVSQDEVQMEPTIYGRLATAMTTAVSRRHGTPRRRRQRTHVVVRTRFVVGALTYRVRFSRSRRVRILDNHNLTDASPATSNVGSRRLRSRSPIKQQADCSVP
jgi:hypothetical protein